MDTVKSRFFSLGLQAGIALQMLLISVLMVTSGGNAVMELSSMYYPLFRGLFLLGFFASMYGMLLFAWKRAGIDYAAIFGVPPEHNYHSVIRSGFTLVSLNFACFVLYFLTITVDVTASKDAWPAAAFFFSVTYLVWPRSWSAEWSDASQRAALFRTLGRVLISPFSASTFAHSFVADVFCSMPKIFSDVFYTACIYATGEAPWGAGTWSKKTLSFSTGLHICTNRNPPYRTMGLLLSVLPFWVRLMQCARAFCDGGCADRRHVANGLKYCCSISVVVLSEIANLEATTSSVAGTSIYASAWLTMGLISTTYCATWDIFVDWGMGPAWWRQRVHGEVPAPVSPTVTLPTSPAAASVGGGGGAGGGAGSPMNGCSMKRTPSSAQLNVAAQLERNRLRMARQSYESYTDSPSSASSPTPRGQPLSAPPPVLAIPASASESFKKRVVAAVAGAPATADGGATFGGWLLRPVRVFPDSVYITAIALNCLARLSWAIYISPGQRIVAQNTTLVLGTVELYRRAQWALMRVEWEQISRSWKAAKESELRGNNNVDASCADGGDDPMAMPAAEGGLSDALLWSNKV